MEITQEDKDKLLKMLAVVYPKGVCSFKTTEHGMPYLTITIMQPDAANGEYPVTRDTTLDKLLMTDIMPALMKKICILDEVAHKWKDKYIECITEVFQNALYNYQGAPKTLIAYAYEALFEELEPRITKPKSSELILPA